MIGTRYVDDMSYWRIWIPGGTGGRRASGLSGSHWAREEAATLFEMDHWGAECHPPVPINGSVPEMIRNRYGVTAQVAKAKLGVGEHHPRMWRTFYSPRPNTTYESEWTMSVQAARNLFLDMRDVFRCVEPTEGPNGDAHGHRIRELLMLACMEVESACKSVLLANHYNGPNGDRMTTNDYVKLLEPLRLDQWELSLVMHNKFPSFKPFGGWTAVRPTESLSWYAQYNAVKHGRETAFHQATLKALVQALGAVFVVVSAQFGPWLPPSDREMDETSSRHSRTPWADDFESLKMLWAEDFAVVTRPEWPLANIYVPPWCSSGTSWTAKTYWP